MRFHTLLKDLPGATVAAPANGRVGPGGRRGASPRVDVTGITADSRQVRAGMIFAAVPGSADDGHRYVGEAVRRGAAAVIVERPAPGVPVPQVVVADSRVALARAAAALAGHPARRLTAVGVTGTNGKSTTAILIRSILERAGRRAGLIGTIHYEVGRRAIPAPLTTPDSVLLQGLLAEMVEAGLDSVVMEVSSHALDQHRTEGIDFAAAVFTNLTGDHKDYHKTREEYQRAKRRLFEGLAPQAAAVLNRADPVSEDFARHTRARTVYYGPGGEVSALVQEMTLSGTQFELFLPSGAVPVRLGLIGQHNVENALAAAGAAFSLGVPPQTIASGLEAVKRVPGRLERVDAGTPFDILVDYAHTDDALLKVLQALKPLTRGRLIAVFGAGGDRDREKRPRMGRAVAQSADLLFVTSDNPRREDPEAIIDEIIAGIDPAARSKVRRQADRRRAIAAAIAQARPGDLILLAGKGHERTQKLRDVEIPFDDREVALSLAERASGPTAGPEARQEHAAG